MTEALGTSTPTSMTVVATSTSTAPARKAAIVASRSAAGTRPWRSESRRPASSPAASSSNVAWADRASSRSDSSIRGHTT
jgi:hypothetical protein